MGKYKRIGNPLGHLKNLCNRAQYYLLVSRVAIGINKIRREAHFETLSATVETFVRTKLGGGEG